MIGRVLKQADGSLYPQTLAGPAAGSICKVAYTCNRDYPLLISQDELGEGFAGISKFDDTYEVKGVDDPIAGSYYLQDDEYLLITTYSSTTGEATLSNGDVVTIDSTTTLYIKTTPATYPTYNPITKTLSVPNIQSNASSASFANQVVSNAVTCDDTYKISFWDDTADGCPENLDYDPSGIFDYNPGTRTLRVTNATVCNNFKAACGCIEYTCTRSLKGLQDPTTNVTSLDIGNGMIVLTGSCIQVNNNTCFCTSVVCLADNTYLPTATNSTGCFMVRSSDGKLHIATDVINTSSGVWICDGRPRIDCGACFGYDIEGFCDGDFGTRTWYIYCNGDSYFGQNGEACFEVNGCMMTCEMCADCVFAGFGHDTTFKDQATWGNQLGIAFGGFDDSTGGSVIFRCNNPSTCQMSMVIDGTVYVDEGRYAVINTNTINNYLPGAGCFEVVTLQAYNNCSSLKSDVLYLVY